MKGRAIIARGAPVRTGASRARTPVSERIRYCLVCQDLVEDGGVCLPCHKLVDQRYYWRRQLNWYWLTTWSLHVFRDRGMQTLRIQRPA